MKNSSRLSSRSCERLVAMRQRLRLDRAVRRKVKQVMPPKAAMYWSCLPIGSLEQVDLDVAGLLGQFARMDRCCASARAAPAAAPW